MDDSGGNRQTACWLGITIPIPIWRCHFYFRRTTTRSNIVIQGLPSRYHSTEVIVLGISCGYAHDEQEYKR